MKKTISALLFLMPLMLCAQQGFHVTVKLEGLGTNKVVFMYQKSGKSARDTIASSKKGLVEWKGVTDEPQLVRMEVLDSTLNLRVGKAVMAFPPLTFLLDNARISIVGNAAEAFASKITSKSEEVMFYEKFRNGDIANIRDTWSLQKEHNRKLNAKDTAGNADIMRRIGALRKENQQYRIRFVDANPTAFVSLIFLQNLFLVMPVDELASRYAKLDDKHKQSKTAQNLNQKIESNRNTAIGKPVVPFSQVGLDGKMVDIAALKGKVILIDFWGSWCVPCRKSHPGMKEAYAKYKSRGFEIIGVSNEQISGVRDGKQQDEVWRKAIAEDGIDWRHILYDPAANDLVKAYDIMVYPTKYLIDQKGNFVMKLLGSSEQIHQSLLKKLEELMPE